MEEGIMQECRNAGMQEGRLKLQGRINPGTGYEV